MSALEVVEEIQAKGYSFVALSNEGLLNRVLSGFESFLAMPVEERDRWNTTSDSDPSWQIGYLPRKAPINVMTGHPYDFKDVFHYQPGLAEKLQKMGIDLAPYAAWLADLDELYKHISQEVSPIVRLIQQSYAGNGSDLSSAYFRGGHTLRLLRYHMKERKEGKVIGLGHVDESVVTVKVFQNIPGIRIGEPNKETLVQIPAGKSILYPGRKIELLSKGAIPALWHDVIDSRQEKDENLKRMSVIFFADTVSE